MTIDTNSFIGAEQVQRAGLFSLFDFLNPTLLEVETFMAVSDEDIATRLGQAYVPTSLEPVANEDFHEGHRPSLISAPIDRYPNVSVYVNRSTPGPGSDQLDQMDAFNDQMIVEIMAKSESSEIEVNRRIKRMAEAVNLVFKGDPTLSGVISGFQTAPTTIFGDVFTRKERTAYGPHWFWQGARMEYVVRKVSVNSQANYGPAIGGVFSAPAPPPSAPLESFVPAGMNIDQA